MIKLGRRKKKYRPNFLAMAVMGIITVLLVIAMASRTAALEERLDTYEAKIDSLNIQIDEANKETEKLEGQRDYMQTLKYIEEMAKNVLGLVAPDEILVMPSE